MTIDLKDFYLEKPMDHYEYVHIPLMMIPKGIMKLYKLDDLVHKGTMYAEVCKGMYGLPQASRIAYDQLKEFLAPHGYEPFPNMPGLWFHKHNSLVFSLVIDDFGIKYMKRTDAEHLLTTIQKLYHSSAEWDGDCYCRLTLNWDYTNRTCNISMPGYIECALQ